MEGVSHNYSYFPIFVKKNYPLTRDELYQKLKDNNIFARRYFYPLISDFVMYKHLESSQSKNLPKAWILANEVICLPLYPELKREDIIFITEILKHTI